MCDKRPVHTSPAEAGARSCGLGHVISPRLRAPKINCVERDTRTEAENTSARPRTRAACVSRSASPGAGPAVTAPARLLSWTCRPPQDAWTGQKTGGGLAPASLGHVVPTLPQAHGCPGLAPRSKLLQPAAGVRGDWLCHEDGPRICTSRENP